MYSALRSKIHCQINKERWETNFPLDDWYNVVNPSGKPLATAPRSICHSGPKLLHRVVHLQVFDEQQRIYLQQRSATKKIQPGKWDSSVGGHVDLNEPILQALIRESREELGIQGFELNFLKRYIWKSPVECELVHSYYCLWQGPITPEPKEIDQGRFWSSKEIKENRHKDIFTANFLWEWDNFLA
jgi:isopentenyldiphosphate isomerase